jgi:hypothetical protein
VIRHRGMLALFLVAIVAAACGSDSTTPSPSTAQALLSAAPASASPTASASPSPSPTPAATPTAVASPTALTTPVPTPKATPTPWQSFTSKRYHYKIQYPPGWVATPGAAGISDQFDGFDWPYVYAERDLVPSGSVASVSKTVTHDIAYWKSHYHATVTSNTPIKLAGWSGRMLTFRGTDNGQTVFFQHIILGKGRVGYFLDMYGLNSSAAADRVLFKRIYTTWRPT